MKKLFLFAAITLCASAANNEVNAQWTRNAPTSQTYLTNTGDNVGIGTTTPAFKLDIQGTGVTTMSLKSTTNNASILLDRGASTNTASLTYRTAGSNNWQTGCVSNNNYTIRNNGLAQLTLHCDYLTNYIGIGTNVPFSNFVVNSGTNANHTRGIWSGQYSAGNLGAIFGGRRARGTEAAPAAVGSADYGVSIVSQNYDGVNYISNGNFGYRITGAAAANNVPGEWFFGASNADDVNSYNNNTVRMVVQSTGNVGIGTISPTVKLDVVGTTKTTNFQMPTGAGVGKVLQSDASGNASWQTPSGGSGQWTTTGNNIYNNNTGNVGIGTSSPNAPLQFSNSVVNRKVVLYDLNNNDHQYYGFGINGGTLRYQVDAPGANHIFYAGANATTSNELMRITGTGNVGIGTSSPAALFDVVSTASTGTSAFIRNTGTGNVGFELRSNGTATQFIDFQDGATGAQTPDYRNRIASTNASLAFSTNTVTNAMVILNAGNIGIGTTNPASKLSVTGDANVDGSLRIRNNAAPANYGRIQHTGAAGNFHLDTYGNGAMYLNYYSGTNVHIGNGAAGYVATFLSNGNVGIGTTTPGYKLDVCGTIRATEVRVETGWCDYVFANDYKLRPLSEVESFIKENKHLPEVTPGAEIESNGLEVGKVSAQMIKKIEELTLYAIEQQKRIDDLKKQMEELKQDKK